MVDKLLSWDSYKGRLTCSIWTCIQKTNILIIPDLYFELGCTMMQVHVILSGSRLTLVMFNYLYPLPLFTRCTLFQISRFLMLWVARKTLHPLHAMSMFDTPPQGLNGKPINVDRCLMKVTLSVPFVKISAA